MTRDGAGGCFIRKIGQEGAGAGGMGCRQYNRASERAKDVEE